MKAKAVEQSLGSTRSPFDGNEPAGYSALDMEAGIQAGSVDTKVILGRVVSGTKRECEKTLCHFNDGGSILLLNSLGILFRSGDEINFPLPTDSAEARRLKSLSFSKAGRTRASRTSVNSSWTLTKNRGAKCDPYPLRSCGSLAFRYTSSRMIRSVASFKCSSSAFLISRYSGQSTP